MRGVAPVGAVLVALLALALPGCSGGNTITGSVTLDGQPLADARVEFHPKSNPNAAAADVRTDQQGKFTILPRPKGGKDPLPPGSYVVLVRKLVDKDGNVPNAEDYGQLEAQGKLINKVPAKYSDIAFPVLSADVSADTKTLPPIEVKSK